MKQSDAMSDNYSLSSQASRTGISGQTTADGQDPSGGTRCQGESGVSQKAEFHNIDNPEDGLFRELAEGARVLDIFSPPRAEYRKAGKGFGPA